MENINGKLNEKPLSLEEFKSIIESLKKQEELETRKEEKSGHFFELNNVDELTEEDQKMWELVNAEWEKAQNKISEYENKIPKEKKSRKLFAEYLSNLIIRKMYKSGKRE